MVEDEKKAGGFRCRKVKIFTITVSMERALLPWGSKALSIDKQTPPRCGERSALYRSISLSKSRSRMISSGEMVTPLPILV